MKRIISLLLVLAISLAALLSCGTGTGGETTAAETTGTEPPTETSSTEDPTPKEDYYAYLFAYFTGNAPSQERIYYAVSRDGYNFTALNNGQPILQSKSGTYCVRDPYIFRGHDGAYYMIATDMKSENGWNSNRNLISWRSEDLLTWTDETIIEIDGKYPVTVGTTRAWAPQALWVEERGEYMIYFALCSGATKGRTIMYYAYSPDLKTLSSQPKLLFEPTNGNSAIDADIIYHDGLYYMFYKDETSGGIHLTTSKYPHRGYSYEDSVLVSRPGLAVEGSSTYELIDGSGWLLIADAYGSGFFTMAHSDDLETFTELRDNQFKFAGFTPRHGSVIPITKEQYDALLEKY